MMRLLKFSMPALLVGMISGYFGAGFREGVLLKGQVLSSKTAPSSAITLTATSTPTPTNTPTPTPSPTPTNTPTPSLTPIPAPAVQSYSSEQIHGFIGSFAGQFGVDESVLRHIAVCESGFNTNAVNGPYAGLYQFSVSAWRNYRAEIGEDANEALRFDPEESVQTAAYILSTNRAYIWPNCVP